MRTFLLAALAILSSAAQPAMADAFTYAGHLGTLPVIAEFTGPETGAQQVGRYAYLSKGIDIPLHVIAGGAGLTLREERPCSEALCRKADGELVTQAPLGAEWVLTGAVGDQHLSGRWRDPDSGKSLKLKLELKGRRKVGDSGDAPFDVFSFYAMASGGEPVASPETLPYDFLRMDTPFERGPETALGDGVIRLDTDPRNGLDYPVVVRLSGADPAVLNAALARHRMLSEAPAFACGATAYHGFGWTGSSSDGSDGFEGNWSVEVKHLSSRLLGWSESGSYFCGGAYPDNFTTEYLVDAKSGEPVVAEHLLIGWAGDGPSAALAAYVNQHRDRSDAAREDECGLPDLVQTNLGVFFRQHSLVFTLKGLPHVIFACSDDLLEIPLKDARPLLTDAGAAYFAEFD
ncbi:hypothetical protein LL06_14690 [Hoeflea sp. BAL378]|uniref:hypothetical protein n=1 Tax=Hoeflea sp. BAL378 TaxID=1547437 RepID=UPI0005129BB2|nr:hypothetical protein [Hoeflea sp. BAL378]KGF68773.1 hypothetical protein LL06_14690 [Hoeflea sp. BAL378]